MTLTIAISFLVISIVIIIFLLSKGDDYLNEVFVYPLSRASFAVFGVGVLLVGISFFQQPWFLSSFLGTLLLIWGIQISLWAIGFSFDFLGNSPTETDTKYLLYLYRYYSEDYRRATKVASIKKGRNLQNSLYYNLVLIIGILKYIKEHKDAEKQTEVVKELRNSVEQLSSLIPEASNYMPVYQRDEILTPLFEIIPFLQFEPPMKTTQLISDLEKIKKRLSDGI